MRIRNLLKILSNKKNIFLPVVLGFSLLGLLMVANELFDFSRLILNPSAPPSPIIWSDLITGLIMLIIVGVITIIVLFKQTVKINNAEEALHKEKAFRYRLIEKAPVFFVAINPDGKIHFINHTMLNALGYQKNEVLKKDYLQQFVPDRQHDMLKKIFTSLQKNGSPTHNENVILTKNGQELWVRWYGQPVYNKNNDYQHLIGVGINITEQKKSEQELENQVKINQILLNTSPVGITFVDKEGKITYANNLAEKILGLNKDELKERTYNDVKWQITDLDGNSFPEEQLPFNLVRKYNKSFYGIEHAIKWPDGRMVFLSINSAPILDEKGHFQGVASSLADITEQKIQEKEREMLLYMEREQSNLIAMEQEMALNLISEKDFSAKLNQALEFVAKIIPNDGADIALLEGDSLHVIAIHGYKDQSCRNIVKNLRQDLKKFSMEQQAVDTKKPILVCDTHNDSRWTVIKGLEWIRAYVKIPFTFEGTVLGTLGIVSEESYAFNKESVKKIESFVHGIAIAIHNYQNYCQMEKTKNDTILAMTRIVETRDPYTAGHQEGVANLATAIAREMGLKNESIEAIRISSLVHDIGKISIPSEILNKPSKLNEIEYNLVKNHPQLGYEILKDISFTFPIAEIVLQHHEKIDGSGYPRGLKGEEIIIEARIICVADVYEAMASHRPYRPALGIKAAEEELLKNKGILYDSEVVDACLRVCQKEQLVTINNN
jgi:PAS domain S-box-containing protein/putative nucleotidyltransferase with HDIG domain